jgi:hypothetical protein
MANFIDRSTRLELIKTLDVTNTEQELINSISCLVVELFLLLGNVKT